VKLRLLLALILVMATVLLIVGDMLVVSQVCKPAAIVTGLVGVVVLLSLLLPPKFRAVAGTRIPVVTLWLLVTGVVLALILEGLLKLVDFVGRLAASRLQGLPYSSELGAALFVALFFFFILLTPSMVIVATEKLFRRKWLWGVYFVVTSFVCTSTMMTQGWQAFLASMPMSVLSILVFAGFFGFLSFAAATWVAGFQLKDYSYLRFQVAVILPKIVETFGRKELFVHSYRSPSIHSVNPVKVTIKLRQESYVARVYGTEKEKGSELQLLSFFPRTLLGGIYRNTRTDAMCRDIRAILSQELGCIPQYESGPSSRPATLDADFEEFALRETRERLSPMLGAIWNRRRTLTRVLIVVIGVPLLYLAWLNPAERIVAVIPIVGFLWQLLDYVSKRK